MGKEADPPQEEELRRKWLEALLKALEASEESLASSFDLLNEPQMGDEAAEILSSGDEEMLSLIVDEALRGIDVRKRYPEIYERLLNEPPLRLAFVDIVEMLDRSRRGDLEPLPQPPSLDLSFLRRSEPQLQLDWPSAGRWRLVWEMAVEQLRRIFDGPASEPAYRDSGDIYEDNSFTLLRADADLDDESWSVRLTAVQRLDAADQLGLTIAVARTAASDPSPPPDVDATVEWGHYRATIRLKTAQRPNANLPPIPLPAILDPEGQLKPNGLRLTLIPVE